MYQKQKPRFEEYAKLKAQRDKNSSNVNGRVVGKGILVYQKVQKAGSTTLTFLLRTFAKAFGYNLRLVGYRTMFRINEKEQVRCLPTPSNNNPINILCKFSGVTMANYYDKSATLLKLITSYSN